MDCERKRERRVKRTKRTEVEREHVDRRRRINVKLGKEGIDEIVDV